MVLWETEKWEMILPFFLQLGLGLRRCIHGIDIRILGSIFAGISTDCMDVVTHGTTTASLCDFHMQGNTTAKCDYDPIQFFTSYHSLRACPVDNR
jgi:hypothetical protein